LPESGRFEDLFLEVKQVRGVHGSALLSETTGRPQCRL
jgi:hypothetical protein